MRTLLSFWRWLASLLLLGLPIVVVTTYLAKPYYMLPGPPVSPPQPI